MSFVLVFPVVEPLTPSLILNSKLSFPPSPAIKSPFQLFFEAIAITVFAVIRSLYSFGHFLKKSSKTPHHFSGTLFIWAYSRGVIFSLEDSGEKSLNMVSSVGKPFTSRLCFSWYLIIPRNVSESYVLLV